MSSRIPWAWFSVPALILAVYLATWLFRRDLGLIHPAANLAYFYYHDDERVDRALYILYWPCYRLFPDCPHNRDRGEISPADMGP